MSLQKRYDFKDYLQEQLNSRVQKNPNYSMRAFAKHLQLDSSHLSKILRSERPLSPTLIESLGVKLGLTTDMIEDYKRGTPQPYQRKLHLIPKEKISQLAIQQFQMLSEWQHTAILELIAHTEFQPKTEWIAQQLNIPLATAESSIRRLVECGALFISEAGRWIKTSPETVTESMDTEIQHLAQKRLLKDLLQKTIHVLEGSESSPRQLLISMVMTNSFKIQEAQTKIRNFQKEILTFLSTTDQRDSLYQVQLAFHPLTKS